MELEEVEAGEEVVAEEEVAEEVAEEEVEEEVGENLVSVFRYSCLLLLWG